MTPPARAGTVLSMTETGPAGAFPADWWAPGLALAERPAPVRGTVPSTQARDRVARWRAGFGAGNRFDQRLAADGLDEVALLGLLTETPAALAARVPRPDWADTAERAVRGAMAHRVDTPDWRTALAAVLRPFVTAATDDLTDRIAEYAHQLDLAALVAAFAERLSRTLVSIAARTFAHELNTAVAAGKVTGAADLASGLTEPARFARLLTTYPVLARLLGQASTFQTDAFAELLTRFAADREKIVTTLLGAADPGPLTEIRAGLGDTHRRGRSVAILTFADGSRVVGKPRDLGAHERFGTAVRWLNTVVPDLDLRTAAAVTRDGYGWVEFVPTRPLPDLAAADRFYRRQGALLALLHALHASDMHFENVIASGDQPVLVDTEALFHPALTASVSDVGGGVDPAARMLAESVQRTGLLPVVVAGEGGAADVSALGGGTVSDVVTDWEPDDQGALREVRRTVTRADAGNLPRLGDDPVDVAEHEDALLDGFRTAYDAITRHREELTDLLDGCADVEVRVAVRHSRGYARLLAESTRPELLRDGLTRDNALDVLWVESAGDPLRWRLCRHEQADLWALDVPVFTTRPGSADLWSTTGHRLPGALERPGLASALAKVNAMSEMDLRDQEWIIAAALATRTPGTAHRAPAPLPGHLAGTAAPPERLLVTACALADRLVARTHAGGDRVNWLGLELVDDQRWLVLPMGAGLGTGYLGVALFLAQLTELSGVPRYADIARSALHGLPQLFDLMRSRPDLAGTVGCGGFHGFGGIAYGLARLTTLLGDDGLRDDTRTAVELAAAAAKAPGPAGVASGGAGCLAAMTAVHAELGLREAEDLAKECADGLAELVRRTGGRCGRPDGPSGFADGAAGIAWALAPHAPEEAALAAAHATAVPGELGWCTGSAGLAIAGVTDQKSALLADRPVLGDLSLCHGELGIVEALAGDHTEHVAAVRRRRAGLILDACTQHGPTCGTPGGVPTPGLLDGVAGIGYGLLRLAHPERVPSVLLLEPSHPTDHVPHTP